MVTIFGGGYVSTYYTSFCSSRGIPSETISFRIFEVDGVLTRKEPSRLYDLLLLGGLTRYDGNDKNAYERNVKAYQKLLAKIDSEHLRSIVFLSSVDVYGTFSDRLLITESFAPNPSDYYSEAKVMIEELVMRYADENSVRSVILRACGIYGIKDASRSAISLICSTAAKEKLIKKTFSGIVERDYVFIDDCTTAIRTCQVDRSIAGLFNLVTGNCIDLSKFIQVVSTMSDSQIVEDQEMQEIRGRFQVFDRRKLDSVLGNLVMRHPYQLLPRMI